MDRLTHQQARELRDRLWPWFNYLARLKGRLERVRFPQDNPIFLAIEKAHGAAQELNTQLHYASCEHGVG